MCKLLAFVLTSSLLLALVGSAHAADGDSAAENGKTQYCVAVLEPIQPGQKYSTLLASDCFDTLAEADLYKAGGWIAGDESGVTARYSNSALLQPAILSIDWTGQYYTGTRTEFATPHSPGCSDGSSFGMPLMPGGWNDVVSSTQGYTGCGQNINWEHSYFNVSGAVRTCWPNCATMGVMDNATSSKQWKP